MKKVFIVAAKRTAVGSFLGSLKNVHPADLGAVLVKDVLESTKLKGTDATRVATVGSPEYISSLTAPYFGLTKNPEFNANDVPLKDRYKVTAVTGFNFTYAISRAYNPDDEKYYIWIWVSANVNGSGYTAPITQAQLKVIQQNMNFNFSENSYLDKENYAYVYSDVVKININGYHLDNWADVN